LKTPKTRGVRENQMRRRTEKKKNAPGRASGQGKIDVPWREFGSGGGKEALRKGKRTSRKTQTTRKEEEREGVLGARGFRKEFRVKAQFGGKKKGPGGRHVRREEATGEEASGWKPQNRQSQERVASKKPAG